MQLISTQRKKNSTQLTDENSLLDLSDDEDEFLTNTDIQPGSITIYLEDYARDLSFYNEQYREKKSRKQEEVRAIQKEITLMFNPELIDFCKALQERRSSVGSNASTSGVLGGVAASKIGIGKHANSSILNELDESLTMQLLGDEQQAGGGSLSQSNTSKKVFPKAQIASCLRHLEKKRFLREQEQIVFRDWRRKRKERLERAKVEQERQKKEEEYGAEKVLESAKREMRNLRTRSQLMQMRLAKDNFATNKLDVEKMTHELYSKMQEDNEAADIRLQRKIQLKDDLYEHRQREAELERANEEKKAEDMEIMAAENERQSKLNAERVRIRDEICRIKEEERQRKILLRAEQEETERLRMMVALEKLRVQNFIHSPNSYPVLAIGIQILFDVLQSEL